MNYFLDLFDVRLKASNFIPTFPESKNGDIERGTYSTYDFFI